jgi:hypothetical protein
MKHILETLAHQLFLVVQLATPDTAQIQPPRSSSDPDGCTTDDAAHPCRLGHHPEPVVRELSRERTGNAMQQTSLPSDSRIDAHGASTAAQPVTHDRPRLRAAFYGCKNRGDTKAIRALARQYASCLHAAEGRMRITRFYYDLPILVDETIELAVHGAGGLARREGGWDELAATLPMPDRGFDVILCAAPRRFFTRRATVGFRREQPAAQHRVPVLFADEPWPDHLPPTPASQRVLDRVRVALAEEDCLTARCQRWVGDG